MSKVVTGKKARFVWLLLSGVSVEDAAERCDRTPRTGYRWLKEDGVQEALHDGQDVLFDELVTGLFETARLGQDRLRVILEDDDVAGYVHVQAAKAALGALVKLHEYGVLVERIEELEELYRQSGGEV